ncbi:olfactory receptor 6Y1-like [Pleurodeles waltl]|uniref:olfactory receptor 6Y1-like n=1 Tax=Pleurodeles waltl TaxID=8319 RepID=UPI0037097B29
MLIIWLVKLDIRLHIPMYFFVSSLSFVEMWYTSVTMPKMLADLLSNDKRISLLGCITQFYFFVSLGTTEDGLLMIMAFDRYLAICKPLRYNSIMSNTFCCKLIVLCYIVGFVSPVIPVAYISQLSFCAPNKIDHFLCDFDPLLKLSCNDTFLSKLTCFVLATTVISVCSVVILSTYICIISSILRIPSNRGRQKAFSTCSSHLTLVILLYVTSGFMYIRPLEQESSHYEKFVSIFYSVIIPLLNPLIYSLRNQQIREALRKAMNKKHT